MTVPETTAACAVLSFTHFYIPSLAFDALFVNFLELHYLAKVDYGISSSRGAQQPGKNLDSTLGSEAWLSEDLNVQRN